MKTFSRLYFALILMLALTVVPAEARAVIPYYITLTINLIVSHHLLMKYGDIDEYSEIEDIRNEM